MNHLITLGIISGAVLFCFLAWLTSGFTVISAMAGLIYLAVYSIVVETRSGDNGY